MHCIIPVLLCAHACLSLPLHIQGKPHRQSVLSYVEAVRYGRLGDQYFVSIYTGTIDNISTFQSVIPRRDPMEYSGTLSGLADMISEDAKRNGSDSARQNIMW